jgi:hypothetical protein
MLTYDQFALGGCKVQTLSKLGSPGRKRVLVLKKSALYEGKAARYHTLVPHAIDAQVAAITDTTRIVLCVRSAIICALSVI